MKKNLYTLEQRIENALAIIDEKGHITLGEYAKVNNLSRTTASKELAKITAAPTMPIDYTGQASHKIWIRRKGEYGFNVLICQRVERCDVSRVDMRQRYMTVGDCFSRR